MIERDSHIDRTDACRGHPLYKHPLYENGKLKCYPLPAGGVELCLWRWRNDGKMPVLLLHGASAGAQTFVIPKQRSLMDRLHEEGYEPWLLDWRGSLNVAERLGSDGLLDNRDTLDFDHTAEHDIPAALDKIRELRPDADQLGAVGFCMGGGTLAQAIAAGYVQERDPPLTHVVLMTLGLFYKTPAVSLLKVQDHLLERLRGLNRGDAGGEVFAIDPRVDDGRYRNEPGWSWPEPLEYLYQNWPGRLQPLHDVGEIRDLRKDERAILRMCNRVSFMFGDPYREMNLVPELHDSELPNQFGAIPIRMYAHGAKNVRRGWAAGFKAIDVAGASGNTERKVGDRHPLRFMRDQCRDCFNELKRVTLITGAMNRLWHRDSIDCMYEWLVHRHARPGERVRKVILDEYGHQDLLWGEQSPRDVFPKILDGLQSDNSARA